MPNDVPVIWTPAEVAQALRITQEQLRTAIEGGYLPALVWGDLIRVRKDDVEGAFRIHRAPVDSLPPAEPRVTVSQPAPVPALAAPEEMDQVEWVKVEPPVIPPEVLAALEDLPDPGEVPDILTPPNAKPASFKLPIALRAIQDAETARWPVEAKDWENAFHGKRLPGVKYVKGAGAAARAIGKQYASFYLAAKTGKLPGVVREYDRVVGWYEWYTEQESLDAFNMEYNTPAVSVPAPAPVNPSEPPPAATPSSQVRQLHLLTAQDAAKHADDEEIGNDDEARRIIGINHLLFRELRDNERIPCHRKPGKGDWRYYWRSDLEDMNREFFPPESQEDQDTADDAPAYKAPRLTRYRQRA